MLNLVAQNWVQVSDTGVDLEVRSSMIKILRIGDTNPYMDTGAEI